MLRPPAVLLALLLCALADTSAFARCVQLEVTRAAWLFASESHTMGFKVIVSGDRTTRRLFAFDAAGEDRVIWEAPLIDPPSVVFIPGNGAVVMTVKNGVCQALGENAVVLYGPGGRIVASHSLNDLISTDELGANLVFSTAGINWTEGMRLRFDPEMQQVVVTLRWGRQLRFDVKTGQLVPGEAFEVRPTR